ncbi:NACHT domain-containing protein [Paraburkholderia dilworthii]|uniref:NACHT domain-containing protein n=1 Tax=Paraburkholderia dilworthii TaxID=948106 RepID=UPI000421DBD6|nr:NACHT domain-containing protein [Paraburkholderia dilworthii]
MDWQQKRQQVELIDDEVKQLQPLLQDILGKLDQVNYVEHTHGPFEKGADFVLERLDSAIGQTYFVGVVVKAGKILSNFSDVERQIDECNQKRLIKGGTQEVRLPEVWVITSKTISQNAKDKISDKYPAKKIYFFESDWLVKMIDRHAPYWWHQLPTHIGIYLGTLNAKIVEINAQTALIKTATTEPTFIDMDVEEIDDDRYKRKGAHNRHRLVNIFEEVTLNKLSILEAPMGFGKSALARRIVTRLSEPDILKASHLLPVFQTFSAFGEGSATPVSERIRLILGDAAFAEANAAGMSFLLVLDGVDEAVADDGEWGHVVNDLVAEVRRSNNIRLLLTTRPFKALTDMESVGASAKRYQIRPLSTGKLIGFIKAMCSNIGLPKKLYHDLSRSQLFRQLPQNPIAASLLSNLISQNKQDLPSNLTELYAKSVESMLGRWDERRALSTEKLYKACERLSRHLARHMLDNELVYISKNEARQMIERFLGDRQMGVPAADVFEYLLTRSNLFGQFPETDTIFFRHRSFAEYLYALDVYELRDSHVAEKAYHPYWVNMFFFYVGLLAECPDLLKNLLRNIPRTDGERWLRLMQTANYLLAGYQSPYEVAEEGVARLLLEAADMYMAARNGTLKSNFDEMSEMRLLWTFAILCKQTLGYDFFKNALTLSLATIDDSAVEEQHKMAALFFGACVLGDLGDQCGFVYLLNRQKAEELPIPISIGIRCEVEFTGTSLQKDPVIKSFQRRLRQLLVGVKGSEIDTRRRLNELFDRPIAATRKPSITDERKHAKLRLH